ncbi:MAG: phospholipid carrier-dependent glycosyltransferase [Cyanobacteria bacterium J06598_1]
MKLPAFGDDGERAGSPGATPYPEGENAGGEASKSAEAYLKTVHVGRWLLGLFFIAFFIRITQLTAKPAWMDEVSTVMFSLGNYSRLIPSDQLISLAQITRGLQLTPGSTAVDAATYLLAENNHPPAYFMLAHGWMMLFHQLTGNTGEGVYASLWAARALPSFLGALAVPVTYWLAWVSFRCRLTALLCAALMAFSPFSVFLSQEARHYTLAILLVMESLGCFVLAVQAVRQHRSLRWLTVLVWVLLNALGIAVHYFCGIAYCAQALVLLGILIYQCRKDGAAWRRAPWIRIYVVAAGTAAGILAWLPVLLHFYGSPQTTYIAAASRGFGFWFGPLGQSLVGWLYALMSPISRGFTWWWVVIIVVLSVGMILGYAPWLMFQLGRSLKAQWVQSAPQSLSRSGLLAIGGFFVVANLLYFAICYVVGFDITRGHRYTFAYYPSIIILAGAGLAPFLSASWKATDLKSANLKSGDLKSGDLKQIEKTVDSEKRLTENPFSRVWIPLTKRSVSGRTFVSVVLIVAFLGTQTIVLNRTHLKFYMPDRFVNAMQAKSEYPVILSMQATVGNQPSVIGNEIVSAAWEVQRQLEKTPDEWVSEPRFVLVERNVVTNNDPIETLKAAIAPAARPFDLWLLSGAPNLQDIGCSEPERGNEGSFSYHHYVCETQSP